ncbi:hypothetical protein [Bacillus thermotolerans]|uniref:hypothetical protein n=1 Tax=Bacillus thermotolerans TaxID=1221996 RepID=UPI000583C452|nr:hypothetical protein [Bacillus thermotolerans]KKB33789.1 putative ATP-binding protein [Bacillus thermotolerans]
MIKPSKETQKNIVVYEEANQKEIKEEKESQAQVLIRLAAGVELFHTMEQEAFARFIVNQHYETWPLRGKGFKLWLTKKYFEETGKAPGSQALADTLGVLEAKALFEGEERRVYTRIAEKDKNIYIDLCNREWEAVKVTVDGWEVVKNPPVMFRRSNIAEEIPRPVKGGRVEDLKPFVNYRNEADWKLIVAWLLAALRPGAPCPVLTMQGEQGSAKSTTTKVLIALIDPSVLPLRALPREERDLSIAAKNTWVLAFDNLSGLSNVMSDALCKLSTGGGLATRKLYSDDEEAVFQVMRPAILNGIDDIAKRQDLLDRSIVLYLPSIAENQRKDEQTFWRDFKATQPRILGALFTHLSGAIKESPHAELTSKPRMADFALWVTAAEKSLGWEKGSFMNVYNSNRQEAIDQGLESDPVGVAVQALMKDKNTWTGTVAETLSVLGMHVDDVRTLKSKSWPTSRQLKQRLRRIAPALRLKGIEFTDLGRRAKGMMIQLDNLAKINTLSTLSTQSLSNQYSTYVHDDVDSEEIFTKEKAYNGTVYVDNADNVEELPGQSYANRESEVL